VIQANSVDNCSIKTSQSKNTTGAMEITAVQGQKEKIGCKLKKKRILETVAFRAQRKITKKTTTT